MMKNLKLGLKIGLGFSLVIIISVLLGVLAIYEMGLVSKESAKLEEEYVPEVKAAAEIRGAANRLMYEMRGFGFTEQKEFHQRALEELKAMETALSEADGLATRARNLAKLRGELDTIKKAKAEYSTAVEATHATVAEMEAVRGELDENAAVYMKNCYDFLAGQNEKYKKTLTLSLNKVHLVERLVNIGTNVRVANYKAQALGSINLMEEAIAGIDEVGNTAEELGKITAEQVDRQRIEAIASAAEGYKTAMEEYLNEFSKGVAADWETLNNLRDKMDENGVVYVKNCSEFLTDQQKNLETEMLERIEKINLANSIVNLGNDTRIKAFKAQALRDPKIMNDAQANFDLMAGKFDELRKITRSGSDLAIIDQVQGAARGYSEAMNAFLEEWVDLQEIGDKRTELGNAMITAARATADAGVTQTAAIAKLAMERLNSASNILLAGLIAALLAGAFIAYFITRMITKPVIRAVDLAKTIQRGDLSKRLNMNQKDEVGQLALALDNMAEGLESKAVLAKRIADGDLTCEVKLASEEDSLGLTLQAMIKSLSEIISQVNEAAGQVAAGSGQVSESSQSLSQGAAEQAASMEEITSTMTEVGAQVRTNAENASQANQAALGAQEAADGGNQQMRQMIEAMEDINYSSKEIAKIIKTIDDIAFQTNLLALNAAVEAARAGKYGKGFAVVAQEVRNLAGRSAEAARETTELIEGSVKKVEKGSEIVDKTAGALNEIAQNISKVTDLVGEIAAASNEQAMGVSQVNDGLGQIEQVTQQNTANAEQTAAAAEELASQASLLKESLAMFILDHNEVGPAVAAKKQISAPSEAAQGWGAYEKEDPTPANPEQAVRPEDLISFDDWK